MNDRSDRKQCKHFTGLHNGACMAGVIYNRVRQEIEETTPNWPGHARWPCMIVDDIDVGGCSRRRFMTPDEEEAEINQALEQAKAAISNLEQGICPECGAVIERREQVGRCVYARPCGHRLYQGRLTD